MVCLANFRTPRPGRINLMRHCTVHSDSWRGSPEELQPQGKIGNQDVWLEEREPGGRRTGEEGAPRTRSRMERMDRGGRFCACRPLGLGTGTGTGDGGPSWRRGPALRPCFGPHSASPTTSPGLRRPAPAPPGPATPLRRPRASLTEAAQVLLSFETGRGSVPALQPAGKRRPKRTSAATATATATAAATVTSSSRSSDSRVAAALRKNRPPLPHCTACLAVT
jgi:hypothetical protein